MGQDRLLADTILEVDQSDFISNLPAYTAGMVGYDILTLARELFDANSYFPYLFGWPFGNTSELTFAGLATKEGAIQVPPGSFLWAITGHAVSTVGATNTSTLFSASVIDKGSGMGITERNIAQSNIYTGRGKIINTDVPFGPFILTSPFIITRPGQVGVKITNLVSDPQIIQLGLHFAVPLNNTSLNTPQIRQV